MNEIPSGPQQMPAQASGRLPRYRRLMRFMVLITSLTATVPLVIMTAVNYYQDRDAYKTESRFAISGILSNTKRKLMFVIQERISAISLVVSQQSYEELRSEGQLMKALRNLKQSFGGFVDLGLIDTDGTQSHYVGPYELMGVNYRDQAWFHEVSLRGEYVSDVFMGHRNFPHFVIAVKKELPGGGFYVLRATLDMELLNQQIYALDLNRDTDAFITNQEGVLQTASAFYGDVFEEIDVEVPPHSRTRDVIKEYEQDGKWVTFGYAYIENSPFLLMAVARQQDPLGHWIQTRSDVLWLLMVSVALILLVVFYRTRHMVNRLRKADMERAKIFHNMEYTAKMATLGRLASGVAHEINNPLAIINENAGLLKDMATYTQDFPKKDRILRLVDSITGSVERCSRVTHRLLGFGRRMDTKNELIDLEHLMKEVVSFQQTEASHRNIEITYDFPKDLPPVESDRGQLQQVFLNLVSNAYAAVGDGGKIDIALSQPNSNEVTVIIADNGPGIPADDLKHIFEPFFSTKGEAGTGLGLSITHDIVEKLGALIDVRSKVNEGTEFIVNLPTEKLQ